MADGETVGAATNSGPTFKDVLAWIEVWRAERFPGCEYLTVAEALSAFRIDTESLEGSDRAVFVNTTAMEPMLLVPCDASDSIHGVSYRWAIGLAILMEMGEDVPNAVAFDAGDGLWDAAEQIGAAMLISRSLIERIVPKSLSDLICMGGMIDANAIKIATLGIMGSMGGADACNKALGGDDVIGTLDEALMVYGSGGGDVNFMLSELHGGPHLDSDHARFDIRRETLRAAIALGRDWSATVLSKFSVESLDIVGIASACGVTIEVTLDQSRGHNVRFYDDGKRARIKGYVRFTDFVNGRWGADACTCMATTIGLGIMVRNGLISSCDIAKDDIDYGLAGEIGAFAIVPHAIVGVAAGNDERSAIEMRDAMLRANPRQGYDLSEIFHVVAFATCGLSPYDDGGELVVTEAA